MAFTVTHIRNNVIGGMYEHLFSIQGPSSYTTNGELFDATTINQVLPKLGGNLQAADIAKIQLWDSEIYNPGAYWCALNRGTNKLLFFTGGTEVASGFNLASAGAVIRVLARYGLGAGD